MKRLEEVNQFWGPLSQGTFGFDESPAVPGWEYDANRWNGWHNPWISRESVQLMADWMQSQESADEPGIRIEWHGDDLHVMDMYYPDEPPVIDEPYEAPDGTLVYSFLTWGYCWSEVSDRPV